jgi:hypothetical protein
MNKKLIAIVLTGLALTVATESAMAAGVNDRERNQKQRIAKGLKPGGGLNVREASKLLDAQTKIRNQERKFRNSGNGLNANERTQLQNRLDVQSARIKLLRQN